jgi:hypothetical protein
VPSNITDKASSRGVSTMLQYLAAVYLTVRIDAFITSHYSLWALVFFLSGFQGFLNCIYFQPRFLRYWRHFQKEWRGQQLMTKNHLTSEFIEIGDADKAKLIHTWSQIAFVEPAVDIITAFDNKTEPISQEKAEEENGFINIPKKQIEKVLELKDQQSSLLEVGNVFLQEKCESKDCTSNQTPIC